MTATGDLLPVADDLDEVGRAMGVAYKALEALENRLGEAVSPWMTSGLIVHRPTFETVGVLAEIIALVEAEVDGYRDLLARYHQYARQLSTMRHEGR